MANDQIDLDKKILARGYWIATHRLALERWATRGLTALIILVYLLFFVQFGLYMYRLNQWQELLARSIVPTIPWSAVNKDLAPLDIDFGTPMVFPQGENKYDFVVEVYNPNQQWALESMNYTFEFGTNEATKADHAFILPGERKYIAVLGYRSTDPIKGVGHFTTSDFRWHKVSHLPPLNWDFTVPPTYTARLATVEKGVQSVLPAEVHWTVRNESTLNIRKVVWQISYLSSGKLVGLSEYTSENFPFLEERDFSLSAPDSIGRVENVKVYPIVNIFDPNFSYLPQS